MMIKSYLPLISLLLLISCTTTNDQPITQTNGQSIIEKSQNVHDPKKQWGSAKLHLHLQEPRIGNPQRYSMVQLNNATGEFELTRSRDQYLSRHLIDASGNRKVYLDDKETQDTTLIKKYRLDPERNERYRNFYQMLLGLPMSLDDAMIQEIGTVEQVSYNGRQCYKIPIVLTEEMFSKYWNIYISSDFYTYQGMEIIFPDEPNKGERLYFEGTVKYDNFWIPRMSHWYDSTDSTYLGSDMIVKRLDE